MTVIKLEKSLKCPHCAGMISKMKAEKQEVWNWEVVVVSCPLCYTIFEVLGR